MKLFKTLKKDEKGMTAIIEAVFVFPIIILITLSLYFLTMYMYSRVTLQVALDTIIDRGGEAFSSSCVEITMGPTYNILIHQQNLKPRNPYRFIFMPKSNLDFEKMISMYSNSRDPSRAEETKINVKFNNYIVFQEIIGTATKRFKFPINLSFVGLPKEVEIAVSTKRMVADQDEMIRNIDLVMDVTSYYDEKYGISDKIKGLGDKIKQCFQ